MYEIAHRHGKNDCQRGRELPDGPSCSPAPDIWPVVAILLRTRRCGAGKSGVSVADMAALEVDRLRQSTRRQGGRAGAAGHIACESRPRQFVVSSAPRAAAKTSLLIDVGGAATEHRHDPCATAGRHRTTIVVGSACCFQERGRPMAESGSTTKSSRLALRGDLARRAAAGAPGTG